MRPGLPKPLSAKSSKHIDFHNYSNITKLEHERRERGFQVFISGANRERLKIRDLQQEALLTKKAQINTNITSTRKLKPPNNTFARRRFWQKNSQIKIKGSDGSKFATQNQKSSKRDIDTYGCVLHDVTTKTKFYPSAQKNSQLNLIRNRYKAYFHIDGYGFCCSKQTSKPSTSAKYQIDGASSIFNRSNSKHLEQIQNKHVWHSCSQQPYNNEEQKSQYYSFLDKNHKPVNKLQEFFTPDYECFQSAKEGTISNSYKGVAIEAPWTDSCNGIIYDVFYHKEQNISRSAMALFPLDNQNVNGFVNNDGNAKDKCNVFFQDEPCAMSSLQITNLKKNEDENDEEAVLYEDERALVLLKNQGSLDGKVIGNNKNEEIEYLPSLEKALSSISKLVKNNYNNEEEKKSMAQEYKFLFNHDDKLSSNGITNSDLISENVDSGKMSTLKLNLLYPCQDFDFKSCDRLTLDSHQSYVGDGTSTSSNDNKSNETPKCSTTNSSTPRSNRISHTRMSDLEKVDLRFLMENKVEKITKREKFLSARVKKLNIRKQIYLSHVLDKLEVAQVTGSIDFNFWQHTPRLEESC